MHTPLQWRRAQRRTWRAPCRWSLGPAPALPHCGGHAWQVDRGEWLPGSPAGLGPAEGRAGAPGDGAGWPREVTLEGGGPVTTTTTYGGGWRMGTPACLVQTTQWGGCCVLWLGNSGNNGRLQLTPAVLVEGMPAPAPPTKDNAAPALVPTAAGMVLAAVAAGTVLPTPGAAPS